MDGPAARQRHVAVVGGGIAGLATAWFLHEVAGDAVRVTVLESSPLIGGKLRVSELAGLPVDEGADSMLQRRPEAVDLARAVGLADQLVHPATHRAALWLGSRLRPLPRRTLMGVPADLSALAASRVLTPTGLARVALDEVLPGSPPEADVAVGPYVAARMGRQLVDRVVEPLLGGVYAGHADRLSLHATVPQLRPYVRTERSLLAAARRALPTESDPPEPLFAGLEGGLGLLPSAVASASHAEIRTGATVRQLVRRGAGARGAGTRGSGTWRLVVGPATAPEVVEADAVVLALPATPAARLLSDVAPAAARELARIDYASVGVVALALPAAAVTGPATGSGFLVPPGKGRRIKAATFSSAKWSWLGRQAPDLTVIRASVGRHGEQADLQQDDDELVRTVVDELGQAIGLTGHPVDARVTRWGGGLPQYEVGHLDRVARIRGAVQAVTGLAVCGAAYDGVGIAACVASARDAATRIVHVLAQDATIGT